MAGLNFSGRASRALNQGTVDYAAMLAASRAANEGLDTMDRRQREAGLMQAPQLMGQRPSAFLNPDVPTPVAAAGQRANYDIGTKYSPVVGVAPPAGTTAEPPKVIVTDPVTDKAPTSFIAADGTPLTPSISEWNAMTGQQQATHLAAVNAARKATRPVAGVQYPGRGGRAAPTALAPPMSLKDYAASLPKDSIARAGNKPVAAGAPANTANLTKNTQSLLAKISQASQTPQGQKIMEFARAVGVNPAVAMATYGMESSFGAQNRSWADAKRTGSGWGVLQVTPDTHRRVTGYFSDPKVLAKYPNEANNINALLQMAAGDPNTEEAQIATGILQMKYIQDIGLKDESLMGAAYQANPHEVLKRGAPVEASDGNMSNSDYSSNWNALFSQANAALGGGASTASSPVPQQAAAGIEMPSTGNKSFDSRVKFAVQKAPGEYDFQTQQLMQSRENHINLLKQKEAAMQQEQEQINFAYQNASQRFAAHKAAGDVLGMTAVMDELSATQRLSSDLQSRSLEFAAQAQSGIDQYNNELIANEADRAVRDLAVGDPTRASSLLSQAGGSQVIFQPRTDGGFVKVDSNGQYVLGADGQAQKFSAQDVAYELYSVADKAKAAAIDSGDASRQSRQEESDFKIKEKTVEILGNMKVAEINGAAEMAKAIQTQRGDIAFAKDMPDGSVVFAYKGDEGKLVTLSPGAVVTLSNGETVPAEEITVKYSAGLKTNG
jgi:hypothetical protein